MFGSKSVASWVCTYDARVIRANVFGLLSSISSIKWHACSCGWIWRYECSSEMKQSVAAQIGYPTISAKVLVGRWVPRNFRWWGVYSPTSQSPAAAVGTLPAWIQGRRANDICLQGQWFNGTWRVASASSQPQLYCGWHHPAAPCCCKWTHRAYAATAWSRCLQRCPDTGDQEVTPLLDCWLIAVRTNAKPEGKMKQHRCTSLLRKGIGKLFNCWFRLRLRSTKPQLKAQHPCTPQSRMQIGT